MNVSHVFRTAFPFISAAASLGGPLGTMAANAIGQALGVENVTPEGIPDAIALATTKDPDALLKLKQIEVDFALRMKVLGYESAEKIEAIEAEDRANARAREMAVRDKIPAILALSVTGGFFSLLWLIAFHEIPMSSEKIIDIMIGSLGSAWIGIVTYYFGSSAGSADKSRTIAAMKTGTQPE